MIKPILLPALLLVVACGANHPEEKAKTKAEVTKTEPRMGNALRFINAYVENCNKMDKAMPVVEWVNANPLATVQFKADLKKMVEDAYAEDSLLGLDADPLLNAQDYPPNGFEAGTIDPVSGLVTVKGKDQTGFEVKIKMVKQGDQWMVDGCGMVNVFTDH
jgi:hypothetical protein